MRVGLLVIVGVACGRSDGPSMQGAASGSQVSRDAAVPLDAAMIAWPNAPGPAAPALLDWPKRSYSELVAAFPTIGTPAGLQIGDLSVRAEKFSIDRARLLVKKPGLGLGVLEDAWGQFVARDREGTAVWLSPTQRTRAHYPARVTTKPDPDEIELSEYQPALERIDAAPDALLPGAGPLLAERVDVLERYRSWMREWADVPIVDEEGVALLAAPAGEWDRRELRIGVRSNKRTKRIWNVSLTIYTHAPPVDEASVLARLHRRWGPSQPSPYGRSWKLPDGLTIRAEHRADATSSHYRIDYSKTGLR